MSWSRPLVGLAACLIAFAAVRAVVGHSARSSPSQPGPASNQTATAAGRAIATAAACRSCAGAAVPVNVNPDRLFPALARRQRQLLQTEPLLQLLPYADGLIRLQLAPDQNPGEAVVELLYRPPLGQALADLERLRRRLHERPNQLRIEPVAQPPTGGPAGRPSLGRG